VYVIEFKGLNPTIEELKTNIIKLAEYDEIQDDIVKLYHKKIVSMINSANANERNLIYNLSCQI